MKWQVVYSKHAIKDSKKIGESGLKEKCIKLIEILKNDPFKKPPPYEKACRGLKWSILKKDKYSASPCISGHSGREGSEGPQTLDPL